MIQIRVHIQNIMTNVVVRKRNEIDILVIENIFVKKKSKRGKTNVNVSNNSWKIVTFGRRSGKSNPVGMMADTHIQFTITICRAWDFAYFRPRQFLN